MARLTVTFQTKSTPAIFGSVLLFAAINTGAGFYTLKHFRDSR